MHKISKRSVSSLLRNDVVRYRMPAAPLSALNLSNLSAGEVDSKQRWFSALPAGTSSASESSDPQSEKYEYEAEVSRLMDLIVNSLYMNKEVFLRELISVTNSELIKDEVDLDIRIQADKDNGIITITNSGIGLISEEQVDCLVTIAQSGTTKFLTALKIPHTSHLWCSAYHLLHVDLFGPVNVMSIAKKKYALVIVDEFTRYTWVYFLHTKNETASILIDHVKHLDKLVKDSVKILRSDNGTEFKNLIMEEFCKNHGIKQEFSAPGTPQQNGVVERKNRTLIEAARTILEEAKLPTYF
ncbi:hypothetical protein AgCh_038463 [Apium graveolens]